MKLVEVLGRVRPSENLVQPQRNEDPVLAESRLSPTRRFLYGGVAALGIGVGFTVAVIGDVAAAELYKAGVVNGFVAAAWISNIHAMAAFVGSVPFLASAVRNRPLDEVLS